MSTDQCLAYSRYLLGSGHYFHCIRELIKAQASVRVEKRLPAWQGSRT